MPVAPDLEAVWPLLEREQVRRDWLGDPLWR
jgi:hypothetical protein